MIKYTITFDFNIREPYRREKFYKDINVTVFAENAKLAVTKAQKLLWDGIYEVVVTSIQAEECLGCQEVERDS